MQTQPLHLSARTRRALSLQNIPERLLEDIHALGTERQDPSALELALELIETRYQEHLARMELQALFAEGKLCHD